MAAAEELQTPIAALELLHLASPAAVIVASIHHQVVSLPLLLLCLNSSYRKLGMGTSDWSGEGCMLPP